MSEVVAQAVACTNIGKKGRARRRRLGFVAMFIAVSLFAYFVIIGASPSMRLLVLVPVLFGAIFLLQARRSVCVAYAATGTRDDVSGDRREKVTSEESRLLKREARRIYRDALGFTALAAVAVLATSLIR